MGKGPSPMIRRAAQFRVLTQKFVKGGMNVWEARIMARKVLDHPVPHLRTNYRAIDQPNKES